MMSQEEFRENILLRLSGVERDQEGMKAIAAEVRDNSKEIAQALQNLCLLMTKMESSHTTLESAVNRAFNDIEDHETRMRVVEGEMPTVKMTRNWTVAGVIGVVGMVGLVLIEFIFKVSHGS
ncbi:MAG: hypothetical protein ABIT70_10930 [Sulfuriferula sp.]